MGKPSAAHLGMRELLTQNRFSFEEEVKVAGHRIDFVLQTGAGPLGVDVNGDRWHRWNKIVECDRVKLTRVFEDPSNPLVLGVWWSRLQRSPESVLSGIATAVGTRRLRFWDWAVPIDTLGPVASERVRFLVRPE